MFKSWQIWEALQTCRFTRVAKVPLFLQERSHLGLSEGWPLALHPAAGCMRMMVMIGLYKGIHRYKVTYTCPPWSWSTRPVGFWWRTQVQFSSEWSKRYLCFNFCIFLSRELLWLSSKIHFGINLPSWETVWCGHCCSLLWRHHC